MVPGFSHYTTGAVRVSICIGTSNISKSCLQKGISYSIKKNTLDRFFFLSIERINENSVISCSTPSTFLNYGVNR